MNPVRDLTASISFQGMTHHQLDLRVSRLERTTEKDAKGVFRTIVKLEGVIYDPQEQPPQEPFHRQLDFTDLDQST